MSNSIWKTPDQRPENDNDIVFMFDDLPITGYYEEVRDTYVEHATGENYYKNELERWAYVKDILAQADKAERLQKAVDLALNWLHTIATAHHPTTTYYNLDAQTAIDEIQQLTQGE